MSLIRQRTKKLVMAGIIGVIIALIPSLLVIGYLYIKNTKYLKETVEIEIALEEMSSVYVLNTIMNAHDLIEREHIKEIKISGYNTTNKLTDTDIIGKRVKLKLEESTILTHDLLYEGEVLTDDMRIHNFNYISLPNELTMGDYIDIRIVFPSGKDFIAVSKKEILSTTDDGYIWMNIYEEEILRLSSAVVDAYLNHGSIYAIKYIDALQEPAIINYPVNNDVEKLIKDNPNIIQQAENVLVSERRSILEEGFIGSEINKKNNSTPHDEDSLEKDDWEYGGTELID